MLKRKFNVEEEERETEVQTKQTKNSLDSDDDDSDSEVDDFRQEEIEGEEEGVAGIKEGVRTTPFNMKEELEEGYFDENGMYQWKRERAIRDNWLDNIDWEKICEEDGGEDNNADNVSNHSIDKINFNSIVCYRNMLNFMQPKETVSKALRRLGGSEKRISTAERLKRKKAGTLESAVEDVESKDSFLRLTELANELLMYAGNVDVYEESYEAIQLRVCEWELQHANQEALPEELDMYSEDFDIRERERLHRVALGPAPSNFDLGNLSPNSQRKETGQ